MKTKQLFFALIISALLPMAAFAATSTDAFVITAAYGVSPTTISLSNISLTSGAKYSGKFDYDPGYPLAYMDNTYIWATTTSPGTAKSVKIYWDMSGDYNDEESTIYVYGKATAFEGTETLSEMAAVGASLIGSRTFAGETSYTIDVSASGATHIAIFGDAETGIAFSQIDITWTVPDVTTYAISTSHTGKGSITVSPASPVAAGTKVTVSFSGTGAKNEIHSYTITGATTIENTDLGEDGYAKNASTTFTMPAHTVDIAAVFDAKPDRAENPIYVDGSASNQSATLESGLTSTFDISIDYNSGTSPAYTQLLKSVTSSRGRVQIANNTFSASTGTGVLTLRGLTTGKDTITITTFQTNGLSKSTRNIYITVTSREVALITELNGKYYAVKNNPSGLTVAAVELFKQGDDYYYKSAGDLSDITWKAENTNAAGTKFYIRNSAGKYLTIDASTISLESSVYSWSLNLDAKLITGYLTGLCYDEDREAFRVANEDVYKSLSTVSACVHEIPISSLHLATEYTRSLTDGNYATMCLPYSVSRSETFFSGVDVYRITGKYMSGDKLTGIEMEEVEDALVAGTPYVILATASSMSVWHGANEVEDPVAALGLVGKLSADVEYVPVGCYGIASNQLRRVAYENTAKVGQYKAYIDITDVPNVSTGTPSPKRRALYVENASSSTEEEQNTNEEQIATSIEDLLNNMTPINWNEPVYNMLGQRVGKGTTGVLIQNGQKFIVQ